ncbi:hypothetical protein JXO52_14125 [bacterium]|nr:hypothetical protein [bacterium]
MPVRPLVLICLAMLLVPAVSTTAQIMPEDAFYHIERPAPGIPSPESVLGFSLGDRPVRYDDILNYATALSEASPRVSLQKTGTSVEGRTLFIMIIGREDRMTALSDVRVRHEKLGDPRITGPRAAADIISREPAVLWMMYNVHGGELSGTDAGLALAYTLAASEDSSIAAIRDSALVIIDPTQNPDGRERGLAQLQQWSGAVPSSDPQSLSHRGTWPGSRANHYLFDMNRDWFILSQPETRARVSAMLQWQPQLVVDAHEMGSSSTYYFNPPREPVNPLIPARIHRWWDIFANDQAAAFDAHGWSYYTRDTFDEWYPGYGSSWPYFLGAVSILYEQASTGGTSVRRPENREMTFAEAVHHQYVSSLANIGTAARHRRALLSDFYAIRTDAVTPPARGAVKAYVILPGRDRTRAEQLLERLMAQGIEVRVTKAPANVSGTGYWKNEQVTLNVPAGTWLIPMDQPLNPLVTALLGHDMRLSSDFLHEERKSLEKGDGTRMYEIGAWNMAMAFGVTTLACRDLPPVKTAPLPEIASRTGSVINPGAGYGYLIAWDDTRAVHALRDCYAADLRIRSASKPFSIGGRDFARGALLLRNRENPQALEEVLTAISRRCGIDVIGVSTAITEKGPDLGGDAFVLLHPPRIALVTGSGISSTSFGALWYLLDKEIGTGCSLLDINSLARTDLRPYNVLLLPSSGSYASILGKNGLAALKTWIGNGGTLIGVDGTAAFLADSTTGLTALRERSDILTKLDEYEYALQAEETAGSLKIDSAAIWNGTAKPAALPTGKREKKEPGLLKREDSRWKIFSPRGTILRVDVNGEHWLGFGVESRVPALVYTSSAYLAKPPMETGARFADGDDLRLSGLLWPEARERWRKTVYAARQRQGNGQVICFCGDPLYRSYFYGTGRMLLNSIFLGPGFGTRPATDL